LFWRSASLTVCFGFCQPPPSLRLGDHIDGLAIADLVFLPDCDQLVPKSGAREDGA
jgi:hypothetical protein